MHHDTVLARRRLYLLARVVVARHYRRRLTLPVVAGALASSPRQLQRAYAQFGEITFHEDLFSRCGTWRTSLATARRLTSRRRSAAVTASRRPASAPRPAGTSGEREPAVG